MTARSPSYQENVTTPGPLSVKNSVKNGSILTFVTARQPVDIGKVSEHGEEANKENVPVSVTDDSDQQSLESGYGSLEMEERPYKEAKTNEYQLCVGSDKVIMKTPKPITINHLLQQKHKVGSGSQKQRSPLYSSSNSYESQFQVRTIFDYFSPI
jgi:hypothetical protein